MNIGGAPNVKTAESEAYIEVHNDSIFERIFHDFQKANDEITAFALYDGTHLENISYRRFYEDILEATGYFRINNISKQHIALLGPNSYRWIVTFFAIMVTGNTAVLANPDLSMEILNDQFEFTDVDMVCYDQNAWNASIPSEKKWVSFEALRIAGGDSFLSVYAWTPDETAVMMFTSGTTGKSKVVEFSIGNLESYLTDLIEIYNDDYNRVLLVPPLYHIMGLVSALIRLCVLQCVCIGRGPQYIVWDMAFLNPSALHMVPSVLESIVKLLKKAKTKEERQKYIGSNLKRITIGGATYNKDLYCYMTQLGIVVEGAYGMTETTGAGTLCELNEHNYTTIGKPYGKTQMRIKDGEVQISGPSVMKGYYKDPEETAKIIVNGWIHTGDMGYRDEEGNYYITGRKKNVIILSNGENVNPEEIEVFFDKCEAIIECMVYSNGKGICADVFTNNKDAAAAFIRSYNDDMPKYRQVYKVNYTEEPLPKTGSGKIKRKENL